MVIFLISYSWGKPCPYDKSESVWYDSLEVYANYPRILSDVRSPIFMKLVNHSDESINISLNTDGTEFQFLLQPRIDSTPASLYSLKIDNYAIQARDTLTIIRPCAISIDELSRRIDNT